MHKSSGYNSTLCCASILWEFMEKSQGGRDLVICTEEPEKMQGFVMWEVLGIFPWQVKLDDPFLSLHFAFYRKTCLRYRIFFFPWCLATEGGWGWQNEDAAGSWGEQKEGKDRQLADDAGESGGRALPWESRAQQGAPPLLRLGSSGDNSMSFPFLWVFHFIPTLAGDKAVWGRSQHLSSLQFYWSTVGSKSSFKN